jgi:hypothetical protein
MNYKESASVLKNFIEFVDENIIYKIANHGDPLKCIGNPFTPCRNPKVDRIRFIKHCQTCGKKTLLITKAI